MNRHPLALLAVLLVLAPARALEPAEIVILVNRKVAASREIADHYIAKRGVPKENVVELNLPTVEEISRTHYDRLVVPVLREALGDRKDSIKCLLATYGIPLRVGGQEPTKDEKKELDALTPTLQEARKALTDLEKAAKKDGVEIAAARAEVKKLEEKYAALSHKESQAAFDSELMLLWQKDYRLVRWQPNPLNWQFSADQRAKLPPILMTCRLDGPTPEIAKRLIDDAVDVEAVGLAGKVYVDARGIGFDPKKPGDSLGYGGYDESFREMAAVFKAAKFDVTLDDKNELFAADSCPDAALYAGWYALGNYVSRAAGSRRGRSPGTSPAVKPSRFAKREVERCGARTC